LPGALISKPEGAAANTTEKFALWFRRFKPNPDAGLRLFCFPFAGGGTLAYNGWAAALAPAFEVYALQLPGREHRFKEKPFDQLLPLVDELVDAVCPPTNKPFAFFGHSLGTLIGFELVRQMRRQKLPGPVHFFVSGWRAPHLPDPYPPLHGMARAGFMQELKRLNGTPESVLQNPDLMEIFLPVLRSDFKMAETYVYENQDPIACPITAFGGRHDLRVSRGELEAWQAHTSDKFRLRMFSGGHFYLQHRQQELCDEIVGDLRGYF
jgi:medium-chain acyl-[acyl-carrier-protein] hydrolase